jgi:hypothetical protein
VAHWNGAEAAAPGMGSAHVAAPMSASCPTNQTREIPLPVSIPKQLGLGFNKTGQQRCFELNKRLE